MSDYYKTVEKSAGITWDELEEREPRLAEVLAHAQAAKPIDKKERRRFDYDHTFGNLRREFEGLVGMYVKPFDPVLSSSEAWWVVFTRIEDEIYDD
jgi:hypothetical protein